MPIAHFDYSYLCCLVVYLLTNSITTISYNGLICFFISSHDVFLWRLILTTQTELVMQTKIATQTKEDKNLNLPLKCI